MINNHNNASKITILLWNANGVSQHKNLLQHLLHEKKINIALITETHLTNNSNFNIFGYTLYKTNHTDGSAHAGTAILISSDIKHNELPCFQEPYMQATIISITIKNIPIKIASVYCPRYKIETDEFNRFFQLLGHSFIAGGDLNSKHFLWGSRKCGIKVFFINLNSLNPHFAKIVEFFVSAIKMIIQI